MQISMGALSEPLHVQLGVPKKKTKYFQKVADAVTTLLIGGFIRDSVAHSARQDLANRIGESISRKSARTVKERA